MARIYLVRHGRAAASFTDDLDPGLDDLGQSQAQTAAENLKDRVPLVLKSSPLARAFETAQPLAGLLGQDVSIEPRVAEIPSPGLSLEERGPWLRGVMQDAWSNQSPELQQWRGDIVSCLLEVEHDTVFFSHYVAINAAVGAATGDDRVLVFRPDNGSISCLSNDGNTLSLVSRGDEAETRVN